MSESTEETTIEEPTTEAAPDKSQEKKYSDADLNRLLAKERKAQQSKLNALQAEFDTLKKDVDDRETAAEEKAKTQVEGLRKDMPENVLKLLDKLTYTEQLEWLSDPANKVEKKSIPELPAPANPKKAEPNRRKFVV